ncbi:hypothetical protein [Listeria newyorkensis]|uniref:hypothetical protein n=1 Tax=Listeria newyorkensis TaxID=1497681 RepID=UPI00051D4AE4|nr:hypothetical protein [Listeria newyorkensis]KGL43596.1 hypothetical protein EP58_07605 [Listeria newyorkensis]
MNGVKIANLPDHERMAGVYELLALEVKSSFRNLFQWGKTYHTIGAKIIERFGDGSFIHYNMCLTVYEDGDRDYIDFSKTRFYPHLTGRVYLTEEQRGESTWKLE